MLGYDYHIESCTRFGQTIIEVRTRISDYFKIVCFGPLNLNELMVFVGGAQTSTTDFIS